VSLHGLYDWDGSEWLRTERVNLDESAPLRSSITLPSDSNA
jgi:hypothetical protein